MTNIIDSDYVFHDGETYGKQLVIEHKQEIPESFLDTLKAKRFASQGAPMGDFHHVASIPTVIYEEWLRQGYDAQKEPLAKTVAKLKAEHLDAFLTTDKRI
jgi:hypothetical protein